MKERYTYDICTRDAAGDASEDAWVVAITGHDALARDPESSARALLERWVIGNRDRLAGGERIMVDSHQRVPSRFTATARVRLYRDAPAGGQNGRPDGGSERRPVAVAYLGYMDAEFGTEPARKPSPLRRLRLPRQRRPEPEPSTHEAA